MTRERTITGKIRDIRLKRFYGGLVHTPEELLKACLNAAGVSADEDYIKKLSDFLIDSYEASHDRSYCREAFKAIVGVDLRDFLDACLGGEESKSE